MPVKPACIEIKLAVVKLAVVRVACSEARGGGLCGVRAAFAIARGVARSERTTLMSSATRILCRDQMRSSSSSSKYILYVVRRKRVVLAALIMAAACIIVLPRSSSSIASLCGGARATGTGA